MRLRGLRLRDFRLVLCLLFGDLVVLTDDFVLITIVSTLVWFGFVGCLIRVGLIVAFGRGVALGWVVGELLFRLGLGFVWLVIDCGLVFLVCGEFIG